MGPPFGAGSISLGLHLASAGDAAARAAALVAQAQEAERAGFDGVTISEHHGGFPGYMGVPCQASNWVLGATERIWSGPAPYLLNLRHPVLVAEELAWSNARFPDRFAAALAPGYSESDFELLGVPFDERGARFEEKLEVLLPTLTASGAGAEDPAFQHWRERPAPLVCAASAKVGARRAARFGLGLLLPSNQSVERMREVITAYREAGGVGTVTRVSPVWLGEPPAGAVRRREEMYRSAAEQGSRQAAGSEAPFLSGNADVVAAALAGYLEQVPLDGLNLRFHLEGVGPEQVHEQIARFGAEVLPRLAPRLATARTSRQGNRKQRGQLAPEERS